MLSVNCGSHADYQNFVVICHIIMIMSLNPILNAVNSVSKNIIFISLNFLTVFAHIGKSSQLIILIFMQYFLYQHPKTNSCAKTILQLSLHMLKLMQDTVP